VLASYLNATNIDNSLAILDRYRVGCVLMNPDSQLIYLLKHTPGWHAQYEDDYCDSPYSPACGRINCRLDHIWPVSHDESLRG
jgi:hypothetical protein